jgi:hypothetical protein
MYVRGMGRVRRGLGMNCPGDIGCPGNPVTDTSLMDLPLIGPFTSGAGQAAIAISAGGGAPGVQTVTGWLTQNMSTVLIGLGAVVAFMALTGRRR